MAKILKFIGRFIFGIVEWGMILVIIFAFAIRASYVQTFIAQKATEILSKKLDHTISIERVDFLFYNKIILDNVYVDDVNRDTLAHIKQVTVSMNFLLLKMRHLSLNKVSLKEGVVYLKKDSISEQFNFQYLADFFSSDTPTKSKPFKINIGHLTISNFHFKLDNEAQKAIPFGVDYNHLDAKKIYLSATNISIKGADVKADIQHISLHEKSGFTLAKMSTKAKLSNKGLFINEAKIFTKNSSVKLPKLYFWMNGLGGFKDFIDTVSFDAFLRYSQISMKDVSYFAPTLKGMDEIVKISAEVKDKVKNLKINNLKLDIREHSTLQGNFTLPDFRALEKEEIKQEIKYAFFNIQELNAIKIPLGDGVRTLDLNEMIQRFDYAEMKNVTTSGTTKNLFIRLNELKTGVGTVKINHNINIYRVNEHTMAFKETRHEDELPITIHNFDLGRLLAQKSFGIVEGAVHLDVEYSTKNGVLVENVIGNIDRFDFNNYSFSDIQLNDVSYTNKVVNGNILVNDPNLDFEFNGNLDFNKNQSFVASLDIRKAYLNRVNLVTSDSLLSIKGLIKTEITGPDLNNYSGFIHLDSVTVSNGSKKFFSKIATINLENGQGSNSLVINSDILDATIKGQLNYQTISTDIRNTLSYSFPTIITSKIPKKNQKQNNFDYSINLKDINTILSIFINDLYIAPATQLAGHYQSASNQLDLDVQSSFVKYKTIKADSISLINNLTSSGIEANYSVRQFYLNDSITFHQVNFNSTGTTNSLLSNLNWDLNRENAAEIKWTTHLTSFDDFQLEIDKSYFTLKSHRWDLQQLTHFSYVEKEMAIRDFLLSHENQFIKINGKISQSPEDELDIIIKDLDLADFTDFVSLKKSVKGIVDGNFHLSDIFNTPRLFGDIAVKDLILDDSEIGDVNLQGKWDNAKKSVNVSGDLINRGVKTFDFFGDYYIQRKKDNLDFKLKFDQTNIAFINSFMDPKVISNIKGLLIGNLAVKGELLKPQISGFLDLKKGNVKVAMFGVNYGFNGKVKVSKDLIQIDNMPVSDEDGNRGYINGGIVHDNFSNFNFDVFVGLDNVTKPNGQPGSFLAMNTNYQEGAIYFGKAYVNGWVNIDGYLDNLNIEVNLKTNKNTSITIPLYGPEEIDDILSYSFIKIDSLDTVVIPEKLDFTGVSLNLNFDLTPDAQIKLVFDDKTGDEMVANGWGQISIKLNTDKDLSMDGTYTITKGSYNFVFNPIKKEFKVESGSSISWKGGSPTDADLNIVAVYKVNTDLSVITPDLESQKSAGGNQNVDARIYISGDLNTPRLSFELLAPKASESAKAALARINSDTDELNKQFFLLLLSGRFQGSGLSASEYGNNAALEVLSGQINNLLDAVSKDVRLNVDLKQNEATGQSSQAIGFEKNFLDDKLVIKGNFGVQNVSEGENNSSSFIGDINLEYIIDEQGNLRVSIFNESNNYSVMQDKNLGPFTQGIGLIYSESFNKVREMNLINFIADWFRKDKHFKFTKRRRQKYLPEYKKVIVPTKENSILEEEEEP